MIVQTSGDGERFAVIAQLEHTRMAGRFAAHWGNTEFSALEPKELMEYMVTHHDQGWEAVDATIGRDPVTGLPYNLVQTPLPEVIKSGRRGPEFNEAHHAYCGLLSSMHTYGLYHGRYGLSDKMFVNMIPEQHRPAVDDLLATELGRQKRLRAALADDPSTAPWVHEDALFHAYKQLQFFDTLALYFNCTHEQARAESVFHNVPRAIGDDVDVTVRRTAPGVYSVAPFPFDTAEVEVTCSARWLTPLPEGADVAAELASAPEYVEIVTLVAS